MAEPCEPWPIDPACPYGIEPVPGLQTPEEVFAIASATEVLWRLTGGIYGLCSVTVRPCGRKCSNFEFFPTQTINGVWINISCPCSESTCGCCYVCEIDLRDTVREIVEVKIDGLVIDPDTYRVDDGRKLVRVGDDVECWPQCQTLGLPDTEPGTFSVTFLRGLPVPPGGKRAVAALAAEILKACANDECRLPARVQLISRQGETFQVINDIEYLRASLTGIPEVDLWLKSVNPTGQRQPSTIWSPDMQPELRVTTWP